MINWVRKFLKSGSATSGLPRAPVVSPADVTKATHREECVSHKKRGDAYFEQGKLNEAAACYQAAITCNPEYAEAYNNWGNACRELNLPEEAERHLHKAATLKPELPNVHYNLASLQLACGKLSEAIESAAREVAREPKHYAALAIMLHLKQKVCDWRDLDAKAKVLRQGISCPATSPEQSFSPFAFMALPGTTREEQKLCAQRWAQAEYRPLIELRPRLSFDHCRPQNSKIVIGYLSADFRNHPVARLIANVLELHDREQFRINAYAYGPGDNSNLRKRIETAVDQFVDIRSISDMDAARRIYADHVDILVDLTGFTANSRSGILALRPVPLQLSYLGYLGTMGADFVDFLLADRFIVPNEHQQDYTEKILYLPHCFQPNDSRRPQPSAPSRASCGLPDHAFVFCCFNQAYKITPEMFEVWCKLLVAVPDSVLWLYAGTPVAEKNLWSEARNRGIDRSRLIMAPKASPDHYLARMHCADLFLDTSPYNAGTTCSDALWMGLPVITCVGQTFSSRMAGSLLSALELSELITYNLDDYYRLALGLASDTQRLAALRSKIIRNRRTTPLFDSVRFTRDLEEVYLKLTRERVSHVAQKQAPFRLEDPPSHDVTTMSSGGKSA